jgi:Zn-dependent peptidase ImmA (M78 family)
MGFRWGFKTEANELADEVRGELGIGPLERLDPRALASCLEIPILGLSELVADAPQIRHLLIVEPEAFSAATVFSGSRRTIVHNDAHAAVRQNSNLAHELAHGILHHPRVCALDDIGCRTWNQDVEDEAAWLSGVLLVSEPATIAIAQGRWTPSQAALRFAVSGRMIQYRLNATGAARRVQRARLTGRSAHR